MNIFPDTDILMPLHLVSMSGTLKTDKEMKVEEIKENLIVKGGEVRSVRRINNQTVDEGDTPVCLAIFYWSSLFTPG